jgi:tetratricopeptide (TPR) repeat protein
MGRDQRCRGPAHRCAWALALVVALHALPASPHGARPAAPQGTAMREAPAPARLLQGMGGYRLEIGTADSLAQRFFDQGLVLAWGFNFSLAERSFLEAARLDPACAMCWWGAAYALSPSINHDIDAASAQRAGRHVRRARELASAATPKERALIQALRARYGSAPRAALDAAYIKAMRGAARQFPEDADVLALLADALMVPRGRDYWQRSGAPRPWTPEILALLERALALAPQHPGANHFYVHLLEDSPTPERARESAQRLLTIAPGVGHLAHMPAHILLRLGDYAGAMQANRNAIAADRALLELDGVDPRYLAGYAVHNQHFLWYAALMAGNSGAAAAAAAELAAYADSAAGAGSSTGTLQHFRALPLYTLARFGRWEAILAEPRPAPATAYTDGVWHYARGMADLRAGQLDSAAGELRLLQGKQRAARQDSAALKNAIPLSTLLALAGELLTAELSAARGNLAAAVRHGRAAVKIESGLEADEPPAWHLPARQTAGALLLEAGRPAEAEQTYREDLKVNPENGWSLQGLADSLARQGRAAEAADVRARLERAWKHADVVLRGARY